MGEKSGKGRLFSVENEEDGRVFSVENEAVGGILGEKEEVRRDVLRKILEECESGRGKM